MGTQDARRGARDGEWDSGDDTECTVQDGEWDGDGDGDGDVRCEMPDARQERGRGMG